MLSKFGNHRKELRPLAIDECAEQQMLQQNNKNIWRGNSALRI